MKLQTHLQHYTSIKTQTHTSSTYRALNLHIWSVCVCVPCVQTFSCLHSPQIKFSHQSFKHQTDSISWADMFRIAWGWGWIFISRWTVPLRCYLVWSLLYGSLAAPHNLEKLDPPTHTHEHNGWMRTQRYWSLHLSIHTPDTHTHTILNTSIRCPLTRPMARSRSHNSSLTVSFHHTHTHTPNEHSVGYITFP